MITRVIAAAALLGTSTLGYYLLRPFQTFPEPADMACLDVEGSYRTLGEPATIYGLGLSYAGHIRESPALYDPERGPPVFRKAHRTLLGGDVLTYPDRDAILEAAARIDPDHAREIAASHGEIPALLDYEVEVGLVILESFDAARLADPEFVAPIGYFVANDVTARILIAFAPSVAETVTYLEAGKGMDGFLPVGDSAWVPADPAPDAGPCVTLTTNVNGERRQHSSFADIILTPKGILARVAAATGISRYEIDDWIITGTPPGVAAQVAPWKQRLLLLLDPSSDTKLRAMAGQAKSPLYLAPGDEVTVSAGHLGQRTVRIR